MEIKLVPLSLDYAEQLLKFELENRPFFEEMVPGRGDHYYKKEKFLTFLTELVVEHEKGEGQYYLILSGDNTIIGRINLFNVKEEPFFSADIGYRIGKKYVRNGLASKSVEMIMTLLKEKYKIMEISAKTTSHNHGSKRILEKSGFLLREVVIGGAKLKDETYDFLAYSWSNL
jgi:ribosomal-protein-alanine N-acetyltransferase